MIAVLILFHAANKRNRIKTILKQDSNSRHRQYIVPVSDLKERKIKTFFSLPVHLSHHRFAAVAVATLSLRCRCCLSCYRYTVDLVIALAVAPLSLLLSLRCCSCCRFCRSAAADVAPSVAPAIAPFIALLSLLPSLCCRSAVALLSLRYRSVVSPLLFRCFSAAAAVTPAVAPLLPLL